MSAAPFALPRIHWLLTLAAFCMLAQSTLLPLASTSAGTWTPVHRHLTLNGVVPDHTHNYEQSQEDARGSSGCVVAATSASMGDTHDEKLVCAPDDGGATSVTAAVQHAPADLPLSLAGIESLTGVPSDGGWSSIVLGILTPPPRAHV